MSGFDYERSRDTAERLIKKFGRDAVLVKVTDSGVAYDPTQTETEYPCILAVLEYKDKDIDGTLVQRGDKMVYVSTQGLQDALSKQDKIIIDGEVHQIIYPVQINPAGTVVYYKAQIRS
jgi:hypothetical protein